jgi:ABC-2 type transport system ATP-binding protein
VLLVGVAAVLAVAAVWAVRLGGGLEVAEEQVRVRATPEPAAGPVELDASVFTPGAAGPYPAVLLAHGFGGSKADLAAEGRLLAQRGYVVMTYTARGFGASGGRIHLNSPDYEIADARLLVNHLAGRADVLLDAPGDPRIGVAGGSYGGALTIMLAGADRRIDAISPRITWHDLAQSLFPQYATSAPPTSPAAFDPSAVPGVFKRVWAGLFFASGSAPDGQPGQSATVCGRFAPDICAAYQRGATTGVPLPRDLRLLRESSPAPLLDGVRAPTLLIQGQSDSLFPLAEGDANALGIAATGTPVKVVWYAGGHDGGDPEAERLERLTADWFGRYLQRDGSPADTTFEVTGAAASLFGARTGADPEVLSAPAFPGAGGESPPRRSVRLSGGPQSIVAPAGGSPAQVTTLPGFGDVISRLVRGSTTALPDIPGQSAVFSTEPMPDRVRIVGSPTVRLAVRSDAPDAILFARLLDVAPDGAGSVLPNRLVSAVRVRPGADGEATIVLPAIVRDVAAGNRLVVAVSTTDQGYSLPADARTYTVVLAGDSTLSLPDVSVQPVPADRSGILLAGGLLLAVGLAGYLALRLNRRRRRRAVAATVDPGLTDVPLAVEGLGKLYAGGFRAVDGVSFTVARGQILGLLGPNGAGKTTVLRMLMGLIHPTAGQIRVFGHRVRPGSPVLSRLGALVEGPGLLPHLTGRANLELYWRATGRPAADAHMDAVVEVAGLGDDLDRRVKNYSQGMRQRLAIAQAMLGLPDLLVLDEPTNGLDPPQIAEMREVLQTYSQTGRTVIVSSHLLAEVERTCTHVVVMNRGRLVAAGPLDALIAADVTATPDAAPANLEDVFLSLIGAR